MNPIDLNNLMQTTTWDSLGYGSYNHVYLSAQPLTIDGVTGLWVLKTPMAISKTDDAINSSARAARKLHLINPDVPVFNIEGYRIELNRDEVPSDDSIQPDVIYIYYSLAGRRDLPCQETLTAAYINESGKVERTLLNEKLDSKIIDDIIKCINEKPKLSFEHENLIFQTLGYKRECLILPYFGKRYAKPYDIANEVINIYKNTRIILLDAEVKGNFLVHDNRLQCVDVDMAYRCDSPISQLNKKEWMDTITDAFNVDEEPTSSVLALSYLEEQLPAGAIEDKFIFPELIAKLYLFREDEKPITVSTLNTLLAVLELSRCYPSLDEEINPDLIIALEYYYDRGTTIDMDLINLIIKDGPETSQQIMDDDDTPTSDFDSISNSWFSFYTPVDNDHPEQPLKKRARIENSDDRVVLFES